MSQSQAETAVAELHVCGNARLETRPSVHRARDPARPVVDLHCHMLHPQTEAFVARLPGRPQPPVASPAIAATSARNAELMATVYRAKLTDPNVRLEDMDAMGVDIQVISPSPTQFHYWVGEEASRELVRGQNEAIAEICSRHPDRFLGFGNVALQHPRSAVEQMRDGVNRLGLRGFEISSMVNGQPVDDEAFAPFWAEAEALDVTVLLHPLGTTVGPRLDDFYLSNIVGQPLETAITLSRMILGGHFDRYPDLRLCAVHGGGYLPLYSERMAHAFTVRPECCACREDPRAYLKRIVFDTVIYDVDHLRRLVEVVGASQVVVGTDYPFDMGHYDPVGLVNACEGLTTADRAAILGGNALRLLGLAGAAAPPS